VKTLKILCREVFLEFPEDWGAEFEEERPRKGKLTFFGPIRSVGNIYFHVGGESGYRLQVSSGTISVFTAEEPIEGSSETVLPSGFAVDVYPATIVTFHAPPEIRVVVGVRPWRKKFAENKES